MFTNAETLIRDGLAQGLKIETIIDAARAKQAAHASPVASKLDPVDSVNTGAWLDASAPDASDSGAAPSDPPPSSAGVEGLSRYDDLGFLGRGSMGEVRRVHDRRLGRQVALKVLHARVVNRPSLAARFLEEAQATAQLQHPGIIPIYDMGVFPDGRAWFTMKEVAGQTLGEVIAEVHAVSRTRWQPTPSGWTLRRLVDVLQQVCDAVGYAHSRGVVHRDLKPENIMLGSHGEVLVLDWGLAKLTGRPDWAEVSDTVGPVETDRSRANVFQTVAGQVAGTPVYMSPEQAEGKVDEIDARSDVYALGALLYVILSGRVPFQGSSVDEVLEQVRSGPPTALGSLFELDDTRRFDATAGVDIGRVRGRTLPPALVAACERAMARAPEDRFDSAAELATELQAWLDGSQRAAEARKVVADAEERGAEADALRARAARLRAEAALALAGVADWQLEEDKLEAWEKQDKAVALEQRAEQATLEKEQLLQGSLIHAPDLPEAHAALAAQYRKEHEVAELARRDTRRAEALFRHHLAALPEEHPHRVGHYTYLKGTGALTLVTDPPGAEVLLHRYVPHRRRLVARFERRLGTTPIWEASLPMGSYLCVLKHPERAVVRYPIRIGRGEHWHGVPPEGGNPVPIVLPKASELGPHDCYVPSGWFACGGDPLQQRGLAAQRIWVDGQVFRRHPVTNREYLAFLDALVAGGRTEEALRHVPRERAGTVGLPGAAIYGFDGSRFFLRPDAEGDQWDLDWPVCMVDQQGAWAFAAWEAARTGQPWGLPGELAWEKAARGVDGRFFPWGDGFDPSWASMQQSHGKRVLPQTVEAFPIDESPYGIRGMAGNMCEWCSDTHADDGPPEASARHGWAVDRTDPSEDGGYSVLRGGSWNSMEASLRCAYRARVVSSLRGNYLGIRLARPHPGPSRS